MNTTAPDTCTWHPFTHVEDLDYDWHPSVSPRDGVSLYLRHGHLRAMVEHADGTNSNVTFYANGRWSTDWRTGTKAQRRVLDRIAALNLSDVQVIIGETAHHIILQGLEGTPSQVRMLTRRLGLESVRVREHLDGDPRTTRLDAVTSTGGSVQYICRQGWRHTC